ncbi:hypothetical protein E2C01_070803 [Portunus trituberculatus]|uniref:Uncharacterized protein n=1 Tax=Portunus trituberculatus TaxID=210409 RepID=A0A5B7I2C0_PORTR|nr:hypothetical protein [Portunus trituberculatus]
MFTSLHAITITAPSERPIPSSLELKRTASLCQLVEVHLTVFRIPSLCITVTLRLVFSNTSVLHHHYFKRLLRAFLNTEDVSTVLKAE